MDTWDTAWQVYNIWCQLPQLTSQNHHHSNFHDELMHWGRRWIQLGVLQRECTEENHWILNNAKNHLSKSQWCTEHGRMHTQDSPQTLKAGKISHLRRSLTCFMSAQTGEMPLQNSYSTNWPPWQGVLNASSSNQLQCRLCLWLCACHEGWSDCDQLVKNKWDWCGWCQEFAT